MILARRRKHREKKLQASRGAAGAANRRSKKIQSGIHLDAIVCTKARIRGVDDPVLSTSAVAHSYVIVQAGISAKVFLRQFRENLFLQDALVQLDHDPSHGGSSGLIRWPVSPHRKQHCGYRLV